MLENLKLMLGIAADDTDRNALLNLILSLTTKRLRLLLGGIEPPEEMEHIILEVSIIRFNRIGSEGFTSHSVEGENISLDSADDFNGFSVEIQAFLDKQNENTRGKVRFL